jgi:hypothetical protein
MKNVLHELKPLPMKTNLYGIVLIMLFSIVCQIDAQVNRELIAFSACNGSGFKSSASDYSLGYTYRATDSTLIISGYLGYENCGIEHIFTANIDSNKVILSEVVVDTLLATCTCSKTIKIEIDSFYFDQFTVEFDGELLTGIPFIKQVNRFRVYPNPTNGVVNVELAESSISADIEIMDFYGRTIQSKQLKGQNLIEVDLSHCASGVYLIRIREFNVTRLLVKK